MWQTFCHSSFCQCQFNCVFWGSFARVLGSICQCLGLRGKVCFGPFWGIGKVWFAKWHRSHQISTCITVQVRPLAMWHEGVTLKRDTPLFAYCCTQLLLINMQAKNAPTALSNVLNMDAFVSHLVIDWFHAFFPKINCERKFTSFVEDYQEYIWLMVVTMKDNTINNNVLLKLLWWQLFIIQQ